ncbi:MAG TPA: VOC family protein [Polyangia bacterium]|jgi:predicted enzyme related to lactoylglutathione lyase|nr:VOC family protein [Polyangia bacterium]
MPAEIAHIEFKSANFARTSEFYAKLFDWQMEQNASASYMKLASSDGPSAGWFRADLVQSPGPVAYLPVDDLEAKLTEVEGAGGRILVRSLPFAGGGEIGLFADPDGNVLGLWQRKGSAGAAPPPKAAVKPAEPAPVKAAKPAAKPAAAKRAPKKETKEPKK